MKLIEIAQRISKHLARFENSETINVRPKPNSIGVQSPWVNRAIDKAVADARCRAGKDGGK